MSTRNYVLNFNDITKVSLTLTFTVFNTVGLNGSVVAPTIVELGAGFYKFSFDVEAVGDDVYYVATDGGVNILTGEIPLDSVASTREDLVRALGLAQENYALDQLVYDGLGNLNTARIRTYSDNASVGTAANVIATYDITATYIGSDMDTYEVVKQ